MSSRPAHAHVSMDKLTTTLTCSPVSPVTSGDAVAQTTSIEMGAPFLKGTILKKGAKGATFRALQSRLHLLYLEGFLPISPYEPFDEYEYQGGIYANRTWECVKVYIDQGISYKYKNPAPFMKKRSQNGNYNVDNWVWESLGFPVMEHLDELFKINSNSGGTTVNVKLKGDDITIEYRLSLYVERHELFIPGSLHTRRRYLDPNGKYSKYPDYILKAIEGVYHWQNETPEIQGVKTTIQVKIYDKNDKLFIPKWSSTGILDSSSINDYDFIADSKKLATIYVEEGYPEGGIIGSLATMVPDVLTGWGKSKKLYIHVRNRGYSPSHSSLIWGRFDRLIEHEFGHVLGLFDAYGYESHFGPLIGNATLPEADIDGIYVTEFSPMLCRWASNPWVRTETDLEMILYAWQENKLQCYINSVMGEKSQAYFH